MRARYLFLSGSTSVKMILAPKPSTAPEGDTGKAEYLLQGVKDEVNGSAGTEVYRFKKSLINQGNRKSQ